MKKVLLSALLLAISAFAEVKLGTGSSTGNYYRMGKDMDKYCQEQ